jgi:hypothetical protein
MPRLNNDILMIKIMAGKKGLGLVIRVILLTVLMLLAKQQ